MASVSFVVQALLVAYLAVGMVRIVPKDEAVGDRAFEAFRATLLAAARSCDQAKLWALFADDFEGPESRRGVPQARAYFEREQREQGAASLPVCRELARALPLGTSKHDSGYCVPYALCVFASVVSEEARVVAVASDVAVHKSPDRVSPVVDRLDYEVAEACLYVSDDSPACDELTPRVGDWYAVITPRRRSGYVRGDDILLPTGDLRFEMARRVQGWRVVGVWRSE